MALIERLPVRFDADRAREWLAVVERAFAAGIERLQATVEPWKVASQRVLEKAGFEREGLLRAYASYAGKPRREFYLYARLR